MTTHADFDRIAAAWLVDGPTELPERVLDAAVDEIHLTRQRRALGLPWRFPAMSSPARIAALVAAVALVAIGALALGAGRNEPAPSVAPSTPTATAAISAPPTVAAVPIPTLDQSYTSPRNGYHLQIPTGATVTPAIKAWAPGSVPPVWGSAALDEIVAGDIRFVGSQQPIPAGQTPEQWLGDYCRAGGGSDCADVPGSWEPITIRGVTAYVDTDGIPAAGGTISPGGRLFEAIATLPTRAYVFTMDGNLDRAVFDAFLATIQLRPAEAIDTPPLTETFTSPRFGYSVKTLPEWTTAAAEKAWTGVTNDSAMMDGVDFTGTDSHLGLTSQPLGDRTFDEFVAAFHADQKAHVPVGCDGGDPSTWPEVQVGDHVGRLEQLCNAAEVLVEVGGRVYLFEYGNGTFESARHFPFVAWKDVLKSITFTPETAK